jgi:hypothetical protein
MALALDAVRAVIEALSGLPHSDDRQRLSGEARACERLVRSWQLFPPTDPEREAVMKRVLNLHVATSQLRAE